MNERKLTIGIPIYNSQKIFKYSFPLICFNCNRHYEKVELIVSDNHSEDDIESIVIECKKKYPKLVIKYLRRESNSGFALNYLDVIESTSTDFLWVIGCDDIPTMEGMDEILEIIENTENIDGIIVNFKTFNFDEYVVSKKIDNFYEKSSDEIRKVYQRITFKEALGRKNAKTGLLGALMLTVIRVGLINLADIKRDDFKGFNTLENMYPHVYLYGMFFMDSEVVYSHNICINVGEGTREWEDESNGYFAAPLALIEMKVYRDMIYYYIKSGLPKKNHFYYLNGSSLIYGFRFIELLNKSRTKEGLEFSVNVRNEVIKSLQYPKYYLGIALRVGSEVKKRMKIK